MNNLVQFDELYITNEHKFIYYKDRYYITYDLISYINDVKTILYIFNIPLFLKNKKWIGDELKLFIDNITNNQKATFNEIEYDINNHMITSPELTMEFNDLFHEKIMQMFKSILTISTTIYNKSMLNESIKNE